MRAPSLHISVFPQPDKRVSWFSFIKPRYGIEQFNIRTYITAVFEEPVDVPDIPHQEREGAGVIAGNGLAHINDVWFVSVQYIELAQIRVHQLCLVIQRIDDPRDLGIGLLQDLPVQHCGAGDTGSPLPR